MNKDSIFIKNQAFLDDRVLNNQPKKVSIYFGILENIGPSTVQIRTINLEQSLICHPALHR